MGKKSKQKEDESKYYDYLVVHTPFGVRDVPSLRPGSQEFANIGEWFRVMLKANRNPVEAVYYCSTVCTPIFHACKIQALIQILLEAVCSCEDCKGI